MWKYSILYLILTVFILIITDVWGSCTFPPEIEGDWISSSLGSISFNSTTLNSISVSTFGNKQFECLENNQYKYLLRSESFEFSTVNFEAFICIDNRPVNSDLWLLRRLTAKDSQNNNERVIIRQAGTQVTMTEACSVQEPYSPEMFSMIGRADSLNGNLSTRCPDIILGEFLVSYSDSSGQSECPNGALLDVCNNKNQLAYNYSLCGKSNSLPEKLNCLYSHVDASTTTTYISVYSETDSKFYCMSVSEDGNQTVYLSQHENDCTDGQTSTTVESTGRLLSLSIEVNSTGKCDVEASDVITTVQPSTTIIGNSDGATTINTTPRSEATNFRIHVIPIVTMAVLFSVISLFV